MNHPKNETIDMKETSAGPTISVCMIAKNEERQLERCLASIKSIADEIIFVDTGSTDKTVEIARKYTDKIWVHPWNDNFSEARGHSIRYATGKWIFIIDADEELIQEDIPMIRKAIEEPGLDCILMQVISRMQGGRSEAIHNSERIFLNNGVIHYEGRVHNRLVGMTARKTFPIRLIHYGYDLNQPQSQQKFERTVSLLNRDIADDPDNPLPWHYLGCSYISRDLFRESLMASSKAIELSKKKQDLNLIYLWSYHNAAMSHYRLNQLQESERTALEGLAGYPNHIDGHFLLTIIYFDQQQWEKVIAEGEHYLSLVRQLRASPESFDDLFTCSLKEEWNIQILLAIALTETGRSQRASEMFESAILISPAPLVALRATGIFFHTKGMMDEARSYLQRAQQVDPDDVTIIELLAKVEEASSEKAPTVSCCMIVKNEAVFLDKCLKSIVDYVDELIVVDTGSTDESVDIARKYTDKIYFHPWEGSFSKARNQSLSYATGDWIFILDGDEEMVEGSGELIRKTVKSAGTVDAFLVTTISTYAGGTRTARHNSERLLRNNGVIHYESIVHNRVVGHVCTGPSKIEIMHYGYSVDEKKANEKYIRTTELLKKQIAEYPDNPMPHHYLCASYLSRRLFRECITEAEKAVELAEKSGDEHELYLWSHHNAAMSYYYLGDMENAERHALRTLVKFAGHMDSFHVLALIAFERKNWKEVMRYGEKYLERLAFYQDHSDEAGVLINTTMEEGPAINLLMGHACYKIKDRQQMLLHYRKAQSLMTDPWQAWLNAATYHMEGAQDFTEAEKLLDEALHLAPEEQGVWYALAKLAFLSKNRDSERAWLTKLFQAGSKDEAVLNRLAVIFLEDSDTSPAIVILEDLLTERPDNLQALINIGIAYKMSNQYERSVEKFMKAIELAPEDPKPWFHLSEISKALGRQEEAEIFGARALALQA